jgi:16S rRNA (cytidine1402-2'-O)-methyltransferase
VREMRLHDDRLARESQRQMVQDAKKPANAVRSGELFVVATPIGNLEDITLRALRILKETDRIACEDTRRTIKLLAHYGIRKPLVSYHEHNEHTRTPELIEKLLGGERIALVTDAGTPMVSDPGHELIAACIGRGIPVTPVPGPSALATALMAAGLPVAEFRFAGFLPARGAQRRARLVELRAERCTLILYEAPHRIAAMLRDACETLGDREAVIAREMTKLHEEFIRGRLCELASAMKDHGTRGECTVLIAPATAEENVRVTNVSSDEAHSSISDLAERISRERGLDHKAALKQAARELGITRREAYARWLRERGARD